MDGRATRILGYIDPLVVRAGDRIAAKLSCPDVPGWTAEVVRMICADPDPRGPGLRTERVATIAPITGIGRAQPIHPGSCMRVDAPGPLAAVTRLVFAAMIFPTLPGQGEQVIASLWNEAARHGWAVLLDSSGALAVRLGDGAGACEMVSTGVALPRRAWSFVAVEIDGDTGEVDLHHAVRHAHPGLPEGADRRAATAVRLRRVPSVPFMLAAAPHPDGRGGFAGTAHFEGKIARPRIVTPPADRDALQAPVGLAGAGVIAAWDLSLGMDSAEVIDRGPHGLHGTTANCPARAVTGPDWDGSVEDFRLAPQLYDAIHFHGDDLYDCGWQTDATLGLPATLRSGFYALRVTAPGCETFLPFFVSAAPGAPRAPVAVVAATATYLAYANTHVKFDSLNSENLFESVVQVGEQEAFLNEHRELGYSTYDTHADGSGVFHSSWLRPLLTLQPGLYTFNYVNDTHLLAWLEATGQPYDVITDHDLHRHGLGLLRHYQVVVTASHPEYYSTPMWNALFAYQQQGGRHMYLGGNGFYWRTAFGTAFPAAIEMRRGIAGVRTWEGEPGEGALAFSAEPGGLWRSAGRAPQLLCGVGFSATIFNRSTHYRRTAASHRPDVAFVFSGVGEDAPIGDFGLRGGGAAGLEIDRWDEVLGSPPNGVVLATSEDVGIGGLLSGEEFITTTRALDAEQNGKVRADICLFATPCGGAVFSVGSIAWITSLPHRGGDNNVARITANVLHRFLDPTPITIAAEARRNDW